MAHRKKKIGAQLVEDEEYQLRYERVAGIDVAKGKADVCTRLPPAREGGRRVSRTEEVAATVTVILALAVRLLADGVELVSMESTSDYWRIWFYVLEAAGLNVQLVNSSHARQLAGRPKTDRLDAQWLARLTEMGLLRPSFVPPAEIRALRDLTRTRLQLVHDRTREWQRLEKLLEGALVKLSSALSSLARVKSARVILEALAGGERDPRVLAGLAARQVRAGRAGIEQAMEGMLYGDHHGRLTRIHLDHITFLDRSVAAIEDDIAAALDAIPAAQGIDAAGARSPDPGPGAAVLPAAERLAEIPGRQGGELARWHGAGEADVPHRRGNAGIGVRSRPVFCGQGTVLALPFRGEDGFCRGEPVTLPSRDPVTGRGSGRRFPGGVLVLSGPLIYLGTAVNQGQQRLLPWTPSPPPRASTPPAPGPPIPAPVPRCSRPRSGSRRSPASAWTSPAPSSPKRAWT